MQETETIGTRQSFSGVLFDFNGTLFFDSVLHEEAWNTWARVQDLPEVDPIRFAATFHGKNNKATLEAWTGRQMDNHEVAQHSEFKETIYRRLCRAKRNELELAPGAIELFRYLQERDIPFGIATSAGWDNVSFYIETFHLDTWFPLHHIVFDDGKMPSKPDPAIYRRAANAIGQPIEACLVFEDAATGMEAAQRASASAICAVCPTSRHTQVLGLPRVRWAIEDFTQFDTSLLAGRIEEE